VVTITTDRPTGVINTLSGWAVARGIELEGLNVSRPSLEEVYLELTAEADDG
jgi:ABC-2 type transport system ATP-binding protein